MLQKHLTCSKKWLLAKIIIARNYFQKLQQYVKQGSKHSRTFEYVMVLIIPGIEKVLNMCEYALE